MSAIVKNPVPRAQGVKNKGTYPVARPQGVCKLLKLNRGMHMKFIGAVAGVLLCLIVSVNPIFAEEGEGKKADTSLVQLDPFVLNVIDSTSSRFAKLGICLDLSEPSLADRVKARNGAIRDAVIMIVTSKTAQDIMSAEGRLQLKDELLERINGLVGNKTVKSIYFTEVVVQ